MNQTEIAYRFASIYFVPRKSTLEVGDLRKDIKLSQTQSNFLLVLVDRPNELVTYDELRESVWGHEPRMDERVRHTMHETKRALVKVLTKEGITPDLIESVSGKGYRLNAEVALFSKDPAEPVGTVEIPLAEPFQPDISAWTNSNSQKARPRSHTIYTIACSLAYGLLYLIALLLEVAYRFDTYSRLALMPGVLIFVVNTVALALAEFVSGRIVRLGKKGALFVPIVILMIAAFASVALGLRWLPNSPVTELRYPAQPATSAFLKNVIIYFLPLGVFFLIMPFYAVSVAEFRSLTAIESKSSIATLVLPKTMLIILFGILVYSLDTSFRLLDNLQTDTYQGLFASLVFIRLFVYFSLGFGSMIWYQIFIGRAMRT